MDTKEMPLEEKYEKTRDARILDRATFYAIHKELGIVDKCIESLVKAQKNMVPSLPAATFKLLKTLAPGTAFNQLMDQSQEERGTDKEGWSGRGSKRGL